MIKGMEALYMLAGVGMIPAGPGGLIAAAAPPGGGTIDGIVVAPVAVATGVDTIAAGGATGVT